MIKLVLWRILSFLFLLTGLALTGYNYFLITNFKYQEPYVIHAHGNSKTEIVNLKEIKYEVGEKTKKYYINDFIEKIRTIDPDIDTIKSNWMGAYQMVGNEKTRKQINDYYYTWLPFDISAEYIINVNIDSNIKRLDGNYEIIWKESRWNSHDGNFVDEKHYKAIIQIDIIKPHTREELDKNPLGISIIDLSLAKIEDGEL